MGLCTSPGPSVSSKNQESLKTARVSSNKLQYWDLLKWGLACWFCQGNPGSLVKTQLQQWEEVKSLPLDLSKTEVDFGEHTGDSISLQLRWFCIALFFPVLVCNTYVLQMQKYVFPRDGNNTLMNNSNNNRSFYPQYLQCKVVVIHVN